MSKGGGNPPQPVDPYRQAGAQYALNTGTANYNAALNRTGNTNALGSSGWNVYGTDPSTGAPLYNFSTQLNPQAQQSISTPLDTSQIYGGGAGSPSVTQGNDQVRNSLFNQQMGYLAPQYAQQQTSQNAQLAAEGATPGSEAWNNAQGNLARNQTFGENQAANSAISGATGQQAQLQNMGLQGLNAQQLAQQEPINLFNMLSGGGGASTAGNTDIMNAFNQQYQGQANAYNAQQASANQQTGQEEQLAAMLAMYAMIPSMIPSDRRIKDAIIPIGKLDNGLTVYKFRYKGDPRTTIGLMADEVEKILPHAVAEINGIKHVNYGAL